MNPRHAAALLVLPLLLSACVDEMILPADLSEHDYRISHPVTVEERAEVAIFDRPAEGVALSAYDRGRLTRLAAESVRRGSGPAQVVAVAGSEGFARSLAAIIKDGGVAEVEVRVVAGEGAPEDGTAVVRVPVWTAVAPECGSFDRGLNPNSSNAPNSNWGCSLQRNRALMVQNPADLIRAREASGRDGNRASQVLDKYGRGEATGSAAEAIKQGSTSPVGSAGGK